MTQSAITRAVALLPEFEKRRSVAKESGQDFVMSISVAAVEAIIAALKEMKGMGEGTHVVAPKEPTIEMLHACQSAMKNYIRSLSPEDRKAMGWKNLEDPSKYGYRIKPYEKAKIRYRAMLAAIEEG